MLLYNTEWVPYTWHLRNKDEKDAIVSLRVIIQCNTCLAMGTQELFERFKEWMNEPLIALLFFPVCFKSQQRVLY